MRTVALDLGKKVIAYCEVAGGEVVQRAMVGSLGALEPLLGTGQRPARVAIEACREPWFFHRQLSEWGNEVLLVDTTRSKQLGIGQNRRKNDRIDAEVLARALARGGVPLAHVLSPHRQELRRQLSVRRAPVETRTQYATTIRGIARPQSSPLVQLHARQMRSCLTPSEQALWQLLRGRALGVTFRRQVAIGRYIADFLAPAARLIVEVDGGYHQRRRDADGRRDRDLNRFGYRVLRLATPLVMSQPS
jgi:very-short-patch-repair endonuclease